MRSATVAGAPWRLLVIDPTRMGDGTATGEVKAAILGAMAADRLMQVFDGGGERLRIAGSTIDRGGGSDTAEQVAAFDPDFVLYRPVPRKRALHAFAMELIEHTNLPLGVWIVDDWPSDYATEDPARAARLDVDLRWLLARADVRFSISPAMSAAFQERYGHPFVAIANGVDPADWAPARLRPGGHCTVRYAGSLAENMTLASVELVARTIEELADAGVAISFEVKTHPYWRSKHQEWLVDLRHTTVTTSDLSAADYRRWLADADVLLIAYNFDARSRAYVRYSLANKLPECLASGAVTLAIGPDEIGTMATMAALDVGERVTTPDAAQVAETLRRLAESPDVRFELAARAQAVAFSHFHIHRSQEAFKEAVTRVAAAHHEGEYPRELRAHVDETAVVASMLHERRGTDHVMVDVGALRGSSAIHFARLGWTVHCYEPHPPSREALAARFAGQPNVHVDARAVGETPAANVPLYESSESSGITALTPFRATHREAARVDVTTIAQLARELALTAVDFLKIDVEGLDLAVLKGVPWETLQPDVVECEFEDAKTLALGHSWRDIGAYLRGRGYAVYVSEWHPIIRYGERHDWRRVAPLSDELEVDPAAWGNFLAFRDDPGFPAIRRAFDRLLERGEARLAPQPGARPPAAKRPNGTPGAGPRRRRRLTAPVGRWLKAHAPALHRLLRGSGR